MSELKTLPPISPTHHRVLSIRMRGLEKNCNEILKCINAPMVSSALEESTNDLISDEKEKVGEIVLRIKKEIRNLAKELELEKSTSNVRRFILSLVSTMWVDLEETQSTNLRGYGRVPEPLKAYWDPKVKALLEEIHKLEKLLAKGH